MTLKCDTQGPGGVLDGGLLGLPLRGMDGSSEAEHPVGGGGPGKVHCRATSPRRTSTVMGNKDRGLADGAYVDGERD